MPNDRREPCWKCGFLDPDQDWASPRCRVCDAPRLDGTPNVQKAIAERRFLEGRYEQARSSISQAGYLPLLDALATAATRTRAVVAMPLGWAERLLSDRNERTVSYRLQVESGLRPPDPPQEDRHRAIVDHYFYGPHGALVVYGALSLDGLGAGSYGDVHLTLKDIAIADRATVAEEDSFTLAERHVRGDQQEMPPGYISTWAERHKLVATKYASELARGDDPAASPTWPIHRDRERKNESFFEVHIYEGFRREAVSEAQVRISGRPAAPVAETIEAPGLRNPDAIALGKLRLAARKIGLPLKETRA